MYNSILGTPSDSHLTECGSDSARESNFDQNSLMDSYQVMNSQWLKVCAKNKTLTSSNNSLLKN